MNKEQLFERVYTMITSSTKQPKHMILSTVKIADLYGGRSSDIEQGLRELVEEGKLKQEKLKEPPYHTAYFLAE